MFILQQKKKIIAITLKSLQQLMHVVAINFEVILCNKNLIAIITRYFNDNFDIIIYMLLQ